MSLPVGVVTKTLSIGRGFDALGNYAALRIVVTPFFGGTAQRLVWSATGETLEAMTVTPSTQTEPDGDATESIDLPVVDQAGWLDGSGNAITGWSYQVSVTPTFTVAGVKTKMKTYTKFVSPLSANSSPIDMDKLADGTAANPVLAPGMYVTSVAGVNGAAVSASDLATALNPQVVREGAAFADIAKQAGVDNTGTTECASAINAALASFASLGVRAYAKGTFKIGSTVTIAANVDFADATFNYTGATGVAVRVGTNTDGATVQDLAVKLPKIYNTAKTITGWSQVAGSIGVEVSNLIGSEVTIPHVGFFERGTRVTGVGTGSVHNKLFLGWLETNKINLYLDGQGTTGWSNQNTYYDGRFFHSSAEGTNVSGTRHIELAQKATGGHQVNGNVFINPSIEANTAEYQLVCAGAANIFINARWESSPSKIWWQVNANRNLVQVGYQVDTITETFEAGVTAVSNNIQGFDRSYYGGSAGSTGLGIYENVSAGPILMMMNAGARLAQVAPATGYGWAIGAQTIAGKRQSDTKDRLKLDGVNGRVYFGDGSTTPTKFLDINSVPTPVIPQTGLINVLGWSLDPASQTGGTAGSSLSAAGTMNGARLWVPVDCTANNIQVYVTNIGVTLTSGQCFAAIYTTAGALLGQSVDQATNWSTSTGVKSAALSAPVALTAGFYDIALWANGTTMPKFAALSTSNVGNWTASSAAARFFTADTGLTTTAPATRTTRSTLSVAFVVTIT